MRSTLGLPAGIFPTISVTLTLANPSAPFEDEIVAEGTNGIEGDGVRGEEK